MAKKLPVSSVLILIFASAFQAFGIYHIHAQSEITEGGIFGLTLLLAHWFSISPALSSLVFNALCYALGWKTLGRRFLLCSCIAAVSYSLAYAIFQQFPPLWTDIDAHPFLASLSGAVFIGFGAGFCVRAGGATCGDDALAMSLSALSGLQIQTIYLISDLSVLLLSLSYIPLQRIVYSLITVLLSGQIIGIVQRFPPRHKPISS